MKFTLFLLISFCAFAANAQIVPSETNLELAPEFRGPIIDGVKEIFEKALKFINESVEKITIKIKEIVDKVKEATDGAIGDALEKGWVIVKQIAELVKTGVVAQVCAKPYENKIAELMQQIQTDTAVCTQKSETELQNILNNIMDSVNEIEGFVKELYDMVSQCYDNDGNILGGTWCVAQKVFAIRDKVQAVITMTEQTIEATKEKALEIVDTHKQCVETAQEAPMKELHYIMMDVQKCVAANQ